MLTYLRRSAQATCGNAILALCYAKICSILCLANSQIGPSILPRFDLASNDTEREEYYGYKICRAGET